MAIKLRDTNRQRYDCVSSLLYISKLKNLSIVPTFHLYQFIENESTNCAHRKYHLKVELPE